MTIRLGQLHDEPANPAGHRNFVRVFSCRIARRDGSSGRNSGHFVAPLENAMRALLYFYNIRNVKLLGDARFLAGLRRETHWPPVSENPEYRF